MPFTKVWDSASDGDYADAANWKLISVRNGSYAWTASGGGGTNEYYLRTSGGANPGFQAAPDAVLIGGASAASGTPGSLASGQYGYGDADTLGYSTIYVRLSDGADPDSKALDHVQFRQTPKATEHVRIPAGKAAITENLNQSSVALGSFVVEPGFTNNFASATEYLRIQTSRFEYSGTGIGYIDLTTSTCDPQIYQTGAPTAIGGCGLYLLGSAIDDISVYSGHVGIAINGGESATVDTLTLVQSQATCWVGPGCALTNLVLYDGKAELSCTATVTLATVFKGTLTTKETVAVTTLTQKGGTVVANATGTIGTYNLYDGTLDLRQSAAARTITTFNKYAGSYTIKRNKEAVTITTEAFQDTVDEAVSAV